MSNAPAFLPSRSRFAWLLPCAVALAMFAAACSRDSESAVRTRVDQWFFVTKTLYFKSKTRCTAAMFRVKADRPRPALAVQTNPAAAKSALRASGISAIRMDGYSPNDMTDALLLTGDGTFGKHTLHAGALAAPCLEGTETGRLFFEALTRPGAVLAYESGNAGVMVLDEVRLRLFYVAGDVW